MAATHTFANSFIYEETDVPEGLTLREWRRSIEPVKESRMRRAVAWLNAAKPASPRPAPALRLRAA